MKIPTVALVGRPNVGKSTLFNRLVGKRISIIDDIPGITRDRIYGDVTHRDIRFHLIDTGGIDVTPELFNKEIIIQASIAIEEADVIVFITDGKEGLTANDHAVRDMLFRSDKKTIVAINKVDSKKARENIYDFYELGFDEYIPVSAEHSDGVNTLLDAIIANFKPQEGEEYAEDVIKFCVLGRPNVGKSSLVNAILNEERVIVSNRAGTTRDAIDTPFTYNKKEYVVIDTAGIRKRGKLFERIEKYSVLRALKAIERSDVCLILIDAETGIIEQDKHITSYIVEAGKAVVIVVNKWDTAKDKNADIKTFTKQIRDNFQFMPYAQIVFLSALTRKRLHTLMPKIDAAFANSRKRIQTSMLNDVIAEAVSLTPPPSYKGRRMKIYYVTQIDTAPPKIVFYVNDKKLLHFSYERYLENKIRESFDLEGTPIILQFKNRGENQ
ncbi:MAG: ribosome biogenesis GTPase Der [Bacilli bacterium]|nr:ribosome biogenesis GTPase Der [Bacilli bacterium]MDD4053432.1 ribosome biogenesis GTPase Der [Bacilli bacterium]MDD4410921.1 ribosome biogenesis GTPase Der [Bacilli bacterium]